MAALPELTATITLTRYNEPNWLVEETLNSLAGQKGLTATVLFLDQMDDSEIASKLDVLSKPTVAFKYERIPARSLSFARNYAIQTAPDDVILFIDSDAVADPFWASRLASHLYSGAAAVVGGRILPLWHKAPPFICRSRVVLEQFSLLDLGEDCIPVRKIVGASFGLNRAAIKDQAYFDETLGRRQGKLLGGEETDLCERVRRADLPVLYDGAAVVRHQILPERARYRWIWKRLYFAGLCRAIKCGAPGPSHSVGRWDYLLLPIILPPYLLGYAYGKLVR